LTAILPSVPGLVPNLDPISGAGTSLAKGAATAVLDGFSAWLADGARSLIGFVVALVTQTSPNLSVHWFADRMSVMLEVVGLVILPLLAAATIGAVARQDLRRLGRTWGVALPLALIVGGGAVPLTEEALSVTDALAHKLWSGAGSDVALALQHVGTALAGTIVSGNPFVGAIVGLVVIAGSVMLWLELLLRAAAIYVAVAFLPLALAGLVWPATAHWAKRLVEVLVALILSKLVIVAALTVAAGAIGAGTTTDQALTGGAILLMAGFAPFLLLRLVPVAEAGAIAHLEGASRRAVRAATGTVSRAASAPYHPAIAALRAGQDGGANDDSGRRSMAETAVRSSDLATIGGEMDREYESLQRARAGAPASEHSGAGDEAMRSRPGSRQAGSPATPPEVSDER